MHYLIFIQQLYEIESFFFLMKKLDKMWMVCMDIVWLVIEQEIMFICLLLIFTMY